MRDLSLTLRAGEVLGLVGESGSGKSITALSIMGLLPPTAAVDSGQIFFQNTDLNTMPPKERRQLCGLSISMVFQEPMTALNPVLTIGEQLAEIFIFRKNQSRPKAWQEAVNLLGRVGLPNPLYAAQSYPHRFSGGMRQRVVMAMAIALRPQLIIADEPTTALDPTIAAQIINLLTDLSCENNSAVIFITHNLRLLKPIAKGILVMYGGLILEQSPNIFEAAAHPYTAGLIKSMPPALDQLAPPRLSPIDGAPPTLGSIPVACPFEPRCEKAFAPCKLACPPLIDLGNGCQVRCFLYGGL
ncbi:MAG: ABC transporter ATP-binding protein [Candidatus Adiutrix sp.]